MIALLSLTSFLGAFLLFSVQSLMAKLLLPELGGAPAVWNTALVFFQAALLAGYLYAHHLSSGGLARGRQMLVHGPLLLAGLLVLPPALQEGWIPTAAANPVLPVLALLAAAIGLPFLALSATAPLVQRWLADSGHPSARDPYFLYAASNLGSLLALLAYPFAIEPWLDLPSQGIAWTAGYALLIPLLGLAALATRAKGPTALAAADPGPPVAPAVRLRWLAFSFVPSSLLLGITTHITTDLAAVPLLWVGPLALYLLTFVLAFAKRPPLPRGLMLRMQAILLPLLALQIFWTTSRLGITLTFHLATFFVTAMVCHGELVRLRPAPARLTEFYLWISLGGVLGGAFNALAAPLLFTSPLEYPLVLLAAALVRPGAWPRGARDLGLAALLALVLVGTMATIAPEADLTDLDLKNPWTIGFVAAVFAVAVMGYGLAARQPFFAVCILAMLVASRVADDPDRTPVAEARSFFGIHRVVADSSGNFHLLTHGNTLHGAQKWLPEPSREPLTYYGREGPLGQALAVLTPRRVALVGLGAGSSLCHGKEGQAWTVYEIDPAMVATARDPAVFRYLTDCAGDAPIILGDARRRMAEAPDGAYDLIILDAFSSDAIPVHLLTREAMALYRRKLAPGGILAMHLSNRYLKLEPLVAALAADAGWAARHQDYDPPPLLEAGQHSGSQWALLAAAEADLGPLAQDDRWYRPQSMDGLVAWTDAHSDLISLILAKRRRLQG